MNNLHNISEMEKEVAFMLSELKKALYNDIKNNAILEGVRVVDECGGAIISFSALRDNLSSSYYIPERQAKIVAENLKNAYSATQFIDKIQKMLNNKSVVNGGHKEQLNEATLKILQRFLDNA